MANFVALFDACVFYPAQLRDLVLRVALSDAFKARWTDRIHDECVSNLLLDRPDIPAERLARTRELMNQAVPDCLVTEYESFIDQLTLPDPDDPSSDPVAGVYFNNLSFSKLDWYLNADTQIGQAVKNGDGTCSYHITVTLTTIMT